MITAEELSRFPDTFNGDDEHLVQCIEALLSLDAKNALVPHGIGGHARGLLSAAMHRLVIQSRAAGAQGASDGPLSSRLRPDVECAPWVIEEVKKLERRLATPQPPKDAGEVPMPERPALPLRINRETLTAPGKWTTQEAEVIRAYGNAREAAANAENAGKVIKAWEAGHAAAAQVRDVVREAAARADAVPVCTCPSGDGSLRHPCPQHPPAEPETTAADNDLVQVERGLLGAACSAIAKKRDAPKVLEALRKITMTPRAELADSLFVGAVKKLVIASRTSGGTAGRDDGLCAALDAVEAMLAEPAARAQVGDLDSVMRARGLPCVSDALGYSRNFAYANPALSQTTRDHIEGLCNMLEIAAANPSPAHAGAGAEALASEIGELVEFQDGSREWTFQRDTLATFARRLAGGDHA